ncbi:MAG: hypothetical protein JXR77_04500, partial [Lentisphaeria bacterium]|nr:hypothetical protein [Lentisphaeria bacterium]
VVLLGPAFAATRTKGATSVTATTCLWTTFRLGLTGAVDSQWVAYIVSDLTDRAGNTTNTSFQIGALLGDCNQSGTVNMADYTILKIAYNHPVSAGTNFCCDFNVSSLINMADLTVLKLAYNHKLPAP